MIQSLYRSQFLLNLELTILVDKIHCRQTCLFCFRFNIYTFQLIYAKITCYCVDVNKILAKLPRTLKFVISWTVFAFFYFKMFEDYVESIPLAFKKVKKNVQTKSPGNLRTYLKKVIMMLLILTNFVGMNWHVKTTKYNCLLTRICSDDASRKIVKPASPVIKSEKIIFHFNMVGKILYIEFSFCFFQ